MREDLRSTIIDLANSETVVRLSVQRKTDPDTIKRSFVVLLARANSNKHRMRFLALYDASFRLVEEGLRREGWCYGTNSPHVAFKRLFPILFPGAGIDPGRLDSIVRCRHRVKKGSGQPDENDISFLKRWIDSARKEFDW